MDDILKIIIYASFAGVTVFLGGILSRLFECYSQNGVLKEEIIHTSIAFGGGVIISAVSFVLVPTGMKQLSLMPIILLFLAGAISFFFLDRFIAKKNGALSQLFAMLLDFFPESVALGAVFATNHNLGLLLAIFIGLQNLPESFNSYLDLRNNGYTSRKCLLILFFLSFIGIFSALLGYLVLSHQPQITASLMLVSSGGILYLIFQDIAPMSKLQQSWFPALGGSLGFLIGMIGEKILG